MNPPDSIQLAALIRQALVAAWWLMPAALLLCAMHFSRAGDTRGRKLVIRCAMIVLGGLLLAVLFSYAARGFAAHGSHSLLNTTLSAGKCLFAPDVFCAWPHGQLIVVPAIYLFLLYLVISGYRARAAQRPD